MLAAPEKAAGQLVGFGMAANKLGFRNLGLRQQLGPDVCLHGFWGYRFFFSSVSVYNGFGLRNKLRDGPLHNEKARGIFFSPSDSTGCGCVKIGLEFGPDRPLVVLPRGTSEAEEAHGSLETWIHPTGFIVAFGKRSHSSDPTKNHSVTKAK